MATARTTEKDRGRLRPRPGQPEKKKDILRPAATGGNVVEPTREPAVFGRYLSDNTYPYRRKPMDPTHRMLRIYTLDPGVSRLDGAITTAPVPYEGLKPGPHGHLFEVELYDDVQGIHYAPVDLDDRFVLGQSGYDASPSDPRFHAQMVYAVANITWQRFREALGRHLNWGSAKAAARGGKIILRPFGVKERNAFYDKEAGEIRFGYFPGDEEVEGRNLPGGYIFTSLSHDVIAHETAHAILDGLRPRFIMPTNPDVYGFHEGFADVVALMQHFTYPDVVAAAIRRSSAALESSELLADIASQFGHTTGAKKPLRSVRQTSDVGTVDPYDKNADSHQMGSVFASAVFEAFATIYRRRAASILRIAGVGPSPLAHELSIELQRELARQASNVARQFMTIAIRAVDLCPPVDLELGEFLRAVITADAELFPDDPWCYREAWIDAFRKRHIYPTDVGSLSEDALRWRTPVAPRLPDIDPLRFSKLEFETVPGEADRPEEIKRRAAALWSYICDSNRLYDFGLAKPDPERRIEQARVVSIRSSRRIGQGGEVSFDVIAQVLQKRQVDVEGRTLRFYGGSTIVIGPAGELRYVIAKNIESRRRLERMMHYAATPAGRDLWTAVLNKQGTAFRMMHKW